MRRKSNNTSSSIALRTRHRLLVTAVSACFAVSSYGLPTDIVGNATLVLNGNQLTITTHAQNTYLTAGTFGIGANEKLVVDQMGLGSALCSSCNALFKVLNDPTKIFGTLTSNGRIWLINPNGIMVGAGARIDVGGFIASSLNITPENFLAGKLRFDATPGAGSVINQGTITTPSGGSVYLIAPNVTNSGIITTPNGETLLAAGQTVTLLDTGTPGVGVEITGTEGNATNLGTIIAEAGRIGIAGVIVKNSGTLNASSVVKEGGKVFLRASQDALLGNTSAINVNGQKGGGRIEVLGGMHSGTTQVAGLLDASATGQGNGGFIETSASRVKVADSTRINTTAVHGHNGLWLIDPNDFIIGTDMSGAAIATMLGATNVIIETHTMGHGGGNGDILVNDSVIWNSSNSLSLLAERNITVSAAMQNSGSGGINFAAGWNYSFGTTNPTVVSGIGSIINNSPVSAGSINWKAGSDVTIAANLRATGTIDINAGGNVTQNANTVISNGTIAGTHDIAVSGTDITLRSVEAQRNVLLNASGNVNLLGLGSGSFIDDTYFIYNLPFTFTYFGVPYTQAYITTNGLITFGTSTSSYTDSLSGLGSYRAIAPAWNDWVLEASTGRDIRIGFGGGVMTVLWDVGRYPSTAPAAKFEAVLNPSGSIRFDYGTATTFGSDVTIGISDGTGNPIASQLMSQPNYGTTSINNLRSTTFTPNGSGGYTETVSTNNLPLATPGPVSGSNILGQGTGVPVAALGTLQINAGGAINAPSRLFAQMLQFVSHGGASFTGANQFNAISASRNYGSGAVTIYNTASPLTISGLANDGGNLIVDNIGGIVVAGAMSVSNDLTMTAHSPITVNNGASITAGGNLTLTAFSSSITSLTDLLNIAGTVGSTGGNILLTGGSGISFASTANISAPAGNIAAASPYGPVTVASGAHLSAAYGITLTSFAANNPTPVTPPETSSGSETFKLTTLLVDINKPLDATISTSDEDSKKKNYNDTEGYKKDKDEEKIGQCS